MCLYIYIYIIECTYLMYIIYGYAGQDDSKVSRCGRVHGPHMAQNASTFQPFARFASCGRCGRKQYVVVWGIFAAFVVNVACLCLRFLTFANEGSGYCS